MIAPKPESQDILRRLVQDFLELLPEKERRVMRLGAISNAFTSQLMQRMAGEETDVTSVLENLQQYQFLSKGEGNWYYYRPDVREILQVFWQQPEQRNEFREANKIALSYFETLANQTDPPANYIFEREVLYHLLLEDEKAGLDYLADRFEQASDQHQLGVAQNYLTRLAETLPQLSSLATEYASYYQARLDFAFNRREGLEKMLVNVFAKVSDPLLKARIGILLGQVWLSEYEWKKSANILRTSLDVLRKLKSWRYAARAMLVLGDIYVDLVDNSGGIQPEKRRYWGKLNYFFYVMVFMPYLALDWLRRKISFSPGSLYFSGNYQEWILNYLLHMAEGWYHRAWKAAQRVGDDETTLNALIGQASAAIQQRREARARLIYAQLAQHPLVTSSTYRSARVLNGLGQISLLAGKPIQASQELNSALETFRSFEDGASLAQTARSLGFAYQQMGNYEAGAQAFLDSFHAFHETHDPLPETQIYWQLQELKGLFNSTPISDSVKQEIEEVLVATPQHEYLARFPSELLQQFRFLAYLVALPLSYLLVLVIGAATSLVLIAIETAARRTAGTLSLTDFFSLVVVTLLPIPLTFWTIEMVYCLLGQAWVRLIGRRSLNLLVEQPDRITITSDMIRIDRPNLGEPTQLPWSEVQTLVSANYKLWHLPISLISRQYVKAGDRPVTIEGITSSYVRLSGEIQRRLRDVAKYINADMVILADRATYFTVLAAILHASLLALLKQGSVTVINVKTCEATPLFLSLLMMFVILNLIMIFPPIVLWRVYLQRKFILRNLDRRRARPGEFLLLSITILLSVIAAFWLVTSPTMKIGGPPPQPEECASQQGILSLKRIQLTSTGENGLGSSRQLPALRRAYRINQPGFAKEIFFSISATSPQNTAELQLATGFEEGQIMAVVDIPSF